MKSIRKPEVKAAISVDGERVDYKYLKISQEMGQHHDFELLLDHTTFDSGFFKNPEKRLSLIQSKVIIDLQHGDDSGNAYVFSGMVRQVRMTAEEGMHGGILLIGKSNTIELERGEMCQSYSKTNLMTILREITSGTVNLSCEIMPEWKADIDFAIQYRETDWQFLQRICRQYRERFYYTGLDLAIGPHPEFPVVELTYDMELRTFDICSRLLPNEFSTYHYRREDHTTLRSDSPGEVEGAGFYLQQLKKPSDRLTRQRKPNVPEEAFVPDMGSLIEQNNRRKVSTGAQMLYIKGEAKTCDVRIGRLVHIGMPKTAGGTDMGLYRVYKTIHELDEVGKYKCLFEGYPADLKYLPTPEIPIPVINPIECEVWRNEDPLGIGRIQIKFPFDERPCSMWIPCMSISAGGNELGLGPVDRGVTMIPEVSDSVLISFLDASQLSRPIVIGSMFHGLNSASRGGNIKNNLKTILTRTGHLIEFNDAKAAWGITIKDKNENIIHLDTNGKSILISAPEKISILSKDIEINAKRQLVINSDKDTIQTVGTHFSMMVRDDAAISYGKNLTATVNNNMKLTTKKDMAVMVVGKYTKAVSKNIKISSSDIVEMLSQGDMKLKSASNVYIAD